MNFTNIVSNERYNKYILYFGPALLVVFIVTAGWFGYGWYLRGYQEAASKDLVNVIDNYNAKLGQLDQSSLKEFEIKFADGAEKHRNTKLYPYFLAYQADVLLKLDNQKKAIEIFELALNSLKKSDPFYCVYATKKALIKMDTEDMKLEGAAELQDLSNNKNNPVQDMALYYLALYELDNGDKATAKRLFEQVVSMGDKLGWYHQAKEKLESLKDESEK